MRNFLFLLNVLLITQVPLYAQHELSSKKYNSIEKLLMKRDYDSASVQISALTASEDKYLLSGELYRRTGLYDSAILYFDSAVYLQSKNPLTNFRAFRGLGLSYDKKGEFENAIKHLYKALEIAERTLKSDYFLAQILLNIGTVIDYNGDSRKSLQYYKESLEIKKSLKDSLGIARLYNNIGVAYKILEVYDSAVIYYEKSLAYADLSKNAQLAWQLSTNLGNVYKRLGNYQKAENYYLRAIEIAKTLNNPSNLSDSYYNIASLAFAKKDYETSEKYFVQAFNISSSLENDFELYYLHGAMSELYDVWGKFKEALYHLNKANEYRDKLFKIEKQKAIAETITKYETEKKEQQIVLQTAEIAKQTAENQQKVFMIIALVAILILLIIIFLLFRNRAKRKQQLLIKEKDLKVKEAQIEATLSSQETERKRFAEDLHDGFGQLISALRLNMSNFSAEGTSENLPAFEHSEKILNEMHKEIRAIAFNLMPNSLIQGGLSAAVEEFALRLNKSGQIMIKVNNFGFEERLPEIMEISLYRIIQEWVNNVIKYAQASLIEIQLNRYDQELNIIIEDNGKGVNQQTLIQSQGNGWKNIQSRISLLKGTIDIDSTTGRPGTSFILEAPIPTSSTVEKIAQ